MPTMRVLTTRPINTRGLTIVYQNGTSRRMPISPRTWEYKDLQRWETIDRQGHKAMSRPVGGGLRSLSFSVLVAALDTHTHVEDQLVHLTNMAARGEVVRIKGGSHYYQGPCWWYLSDLALNATRLTPWGRVSQATVTFSFVEYVNTSVSVMKPPPPPRPKPKPKPKPTPPKAPVYRYHTVVRGDWLSKLAIRYLGNVNRWREIYNLNRAVVGPNPNLIRPGQKLKIPPK